jgi:hypothetical protein
VLIELTEFLKIETLLAYWNQTEIFGILCCVTSRHLKPGYTHKITQSKPSFCSQLLSSKHKAKEMSHLMYFISSVLLTLSFLCTLFTLRTRVLESKQGKYTNRFFNLHLARQDVITRLIQLRKFELQLFDWGRDK